MFRRVCHKHPAATDPGERRPDHRDICPGLDPVPQAPLVFIVFRLFDAQRFFDVLLLPVVSFDQRLLSPLLLLNQCVFDNQLPDRGHSSAGCYRVVPDEVHPQLVSLRPQLLDLAQLLLPGPVAFFLCLLFFCERLCLFFLPLVDLQPRRVVVP